MGDRKTIQYFVDFFESKKNKDEIETVTETDTSRHNIDYYVAHNHDKSNIYSIKYKDDTYFLGYFDYIKVTVKVQPSAGNIDCCVYFKKDENDNIITINMDTDGTISSFNLKTLILLPDDLGRQFKNIYLIPKDTIFKIGVREPANEPEPISTTECVGTTGCGRWWGGGKSAKKQKKRRSKITSRNRKSRSNKRKIKN
jgi:hypothetical protein